MLAADLAWERRVNTVVIGATWIAFILGVVISLWGISTNSSAFNMALGAAGAGAIWVAAVSFIPLWVVRRPLALEAIALSGVAVSMVSVAVTNSDSQNAFIVLSLTPTIYTAVHGGFRVGVGTAGLSAIILEAITFIQTREPFAAATNMFLYFVLAVTIAQIRRMLVESQRASAALERSSLESEQRLQSLEGAHTLLSRLAELTGTSEMSPVAVGRMAVEMVCESIPDSAATASIIGEEGPILVAKHGVAPDPSIETEVPLTIGDRIVGTVKVRTVRLLDRGEVEGLETALRPLALAFSNARLLQEITGNAVKAERVRLARELHDEIGPGLASLGLALDLALVQGSSQSELTNHMEQLRGRVTDLVDEVRATVSDLRTGKTPTLRTVVDKAVADNAPAMEVSFEVDERRPVRPSLSEAVHGIVGEALRNAILHSHGSAVRVTGWVDFDRGKVVVEDDGDGFDLSALPAGHFGVIGMRERASEAGVALDVASGEAGTRVLIEWS